MRPDYAPLLGDAAARATAYLADVDERPVFPDDAARNGLRAFDEGLPTTPTDPAAVLALLDDYGSPATVTSNGPHYYGYVLGGANPAALAADWLASAWDQCASTPVTSPAAHAVEAAGARLLLEALDLPRDAAVGFGTSATACGLGLLACARAELCRRRGYDLHARGLAGAPPVRLVVPDTVHVTVLKAAKLLGFGTDNVERVPTDAQGRIDPAALPSLDDACILVLQAGEVNTGSFDDFAALIPLARAAEAWVHVDGAFGLWARAAPALAHLTAGIELADSWTTDGHKTLSTPYDGAVAICRHGEAYAKTMDAATVYAPASATSQSALTLEFSRRARGIPIWATLRTMGREGLAAHVTGLHERARELADGCRAVGLEVLNEVTFNQVLCRLPGSPERQADFVARLQAGGRLWFGTTVWRGRPAFRLSVSHFATGPEDIARAVVVLGEGLTHSTPT